LREFGVANPGNQENKNNENLDASANANVSSTMAADSQKPRELKTTGFPFPFFFSEK